MAHLAHLCHIFVFFSLFWFSEGFDLLSEDPLRFLQIFLVVPVLYHLSIQEYLKISKDICGVARDISFDILI